MERCLDCVAGSGLRRSVSSASERVSGFVLGHFRLYDELARGAAAGGLRSREPSGDSGDDQRGDRTDALPRTAAAFAALANEATTETGWEDFEFGLTTLLDGIEIMLLRMTEFWVPAGTLVPTSPPAAKRSKQTS